MAALASTTPPRSTPQPVRIDRSDCSASRNACTPSAETAVRFQPFCVYGVGRFVRTTPAETPVRFRRFYTGAAWLIYPTVICAWLYLAILAGTQLVLGQRAGAWVAWQVFPLALAMVLVVGGCRLLISLLQRKDVVPTLFGGSERSHDASHAADAVATVS